MFKEAYEAGQDSAFEKLSAPNAGRRRQGLSRTNNERLKRHFGSSWRKHKISELPPRGSGLPRSRRGRSV